jgi:hypothetical protein
MACGTDGIIFAPAANQRRRSEIMPADVPPRRTHMNVDQVMGTITTVMTQLGLKILGAVLLWVAGRKLIGLGLKLLTRELDRNQFDVTVSRYVPTHGGRVDCNQAREEYDGTRSELVLPRGRSE